MAMLISLFTLSTFRFFKTKNSNWMYFGLGWLITILAALVQFFKLATDPIYFNHNSTAHLISFIALTFIFIGAKNLEKS